MEYAPPKPRDPNPWVLQAPHRHYPLQFETRTHSAFDCATPPPKPRDPSPWVLQGSKSLGSSRIQVPGFFRDPNPWVLQGSKSLGSSGIQIPGFFRDPNPWVLQGSKSLGSSGIQVPGFFKDPSPWVLQGSKSLGSLSAAPTQSVACRAAMGGLLQSCLRDGGDISIVWVEEPRDLDPWA